MNNDLNLIHLLIPKIENPVVKIRGKEALNPNWLLLKKLAINYPGAIFWQFPVILIV